MKGSLFLISLVIVSGLLLTPAVLYADTGQGTYGKAPVGQPLVREGTLATRLVEALGLGTASNEAEAESMLAAVGVAPRNGWIADYPVTPDIAGELQSAVGEAADAKRLTMAKDDALKAFQDVISGYDLSFRPSASDQYAGGTATYDNPDQTIINNYYYDEGPPVVTYYTPPPYYYPLYTWVPYPFWWWDFWFPGFFVLIDFHRTVFVNGHRFFCSNHFFNPVTHSVVRIDPVSRFSGKTFAGVGGSRSFVSAGSPGAGFSGNRNAAVSSGRAAPLSGGNRTFSGSSGINRTMGPTGGGWRGSRTAVSPSGDTRTFNAASTYRGSAASPAYSRGGSGSYTGQRTFASSAGSRTFSSAPAVSRSYNSGYSGRTSSASTAMSRTFSPSAGGSRGSFGGLHR